MLDPQTYLQMMTTLFITVDPIAAAPLFLTLTAQDTPPMRASVANRASLTMTLLLLGTLAAGGFVLNLFSIRVASFRVVGGILFLLMALDMLRARAHSARITREEETEATAREDVAVVPLGIPMLAGPGAISTVILFANHPFDWRHMLILTAMIVLVGVMTWGLLRLAAPIGRYLGKTGINVVNRLMGILIGAIGIEYLSRGIAELLPALAGK